MDSKVGLLEASISSVTAALDLLLEPVSSTQINN